MKDDISGYYVFHFSKMDNTNQYGNMTKEDVLKLISGNNFIDSDEEEEERSPSLVSAKSRLHTSTTRRNLNSDLESQSQSQLSTPTIPPASQQDTINNIPPPRSPPAVKKPEQDDDDSDNNKDDNNNSDNDQHDDIQPTPANNNAKMNYLITYQNADVVKIPDRRAFANFVIESFRDPRDEVDIIAKYAVSAETHLQTRGFHYHMALGLTSQRRWLAVQKRMEKSKGVHCDFRERGGTYYDVFDYVQKLDSHIFLSPGHAGLVNPVQPRTTSAIKARKRAGNSGAGGHQRPKPAKAAKPVKKEKRMDMDVLHDIIVNNQIRTDEQLAALAKNSAADGKRDLQRWLMSHPSAKTRCDILNTVWMMEDSPARLARKNKTNLQLVEECLDKEHCTDEHGVQCDGSWYTAAQDILTKNNISRSDFVAKIRNALIHGRGKAYNLMIHGPTQCAKSFIFMPMTKIFKVFWQPASASYNWVSAPEKELIFLNDIRYLEDGDTKVLPWGRFLNLLEGCPLNIERPSNFYASDFEWSDRKAPIFATTDYPIQRIVKGRIDRHETDQMDKRWVFVKFQHQFLGAECNYDLVTCKRCFAEFVLITDDMLGDE